MAIKKVNADLQVVGRILRSFSGTHHLDSATDIETALELLDQAIAVQGGTAFARKHIEEVVTPTLQVIISNVHELVNVPGATVQIYEPGTGDSWEEALAQVKWSSDWHIVQIDFEENFTGKIVLVG